MEQKSNTNESFFYTYSSKDNAEIEEIRKKYLPQSESEFEELKRLDGIVQKAGINEALTAGIGGMTFFGLGMCLSMQIISSGMVAIILGVLFSIIGSTGMIIAYPTYRKIMNIKKQDLTPRILELASKLSEKRIN